MREGDQLVKIQGLMNKPFLLTFAGCLLGAMLPVSAQTPAPTDPAAPAAQPAPPPMKEVAVIKTSKGEMTVEFWSDVAPKTVENFKKLAKQGFYNGTAFHRIIKGFMIQGGDPNTKDPAKEASYGMGDPGYKIKAEFNPRKHEAGVISMARSMDPDSAGSQFFICLDVASQLDGQYTAFGKLTKGEDVLQKIGDTPVVSNGRERSKPAERVGVESVSIISVPVK